MKAASFIVKNGRKELHRVLGHIANINDTTSNATVVEESRRLNVEPICVTALSCLAKARKVDYAMMYSRQ